VGSGLDFSSLNTRETDTGSEVFNIKGQPVSRYLFGSTGQFRLNDMERDLFLQDKWSPFSGFVLGAGARWDSDGAIASSRTTPRVSAAYSLPKIPVRLYAALTYVPEIVNPNLMGRPNEWSLYEPLNRLGIIAGQLLISLYRINRTLLSDPDMLNKSVGLSARLPARIEFDTQYLQKRSDNGLAYTPMATLGSFVLPASLPAKTAPSLYSLGNTATFRYDAVSVSIRKHFSANFDLFAHYTLANGTSNSVYDLSNFTSLSYTNLSGRLPWSVRNNFVFGGRAPWRAWTFGIFANLRSGMPYSLHYDSGAQFGAADGFTMPGEILLNLEIARKITLPFRSRLQLFEIVLTTVNVPNFANYTWVNSDLSAPQRFINPTPRSFSFSIRRPTERRADTSATFQDPAEHRFDTHN
jgi:hypothetical protein